MGARGRCIAGRRYEDLCSSDQHRRVSMLSTLRAVLFLFSSLCPGSGLWIVLSIPLSAGHVLSSFPALMDIKIICQVSHSDFLFESSNNSTSEAKKGMDDRKWENCRTKGIKNQAWQGQEPGLALGVWRTKGGGLSGLALRANGCHTELHACLCFFCLLSCVPPSKIQLPRRRS